MWVDVAYLRNICPHRQRLFLCLVAGICASVGLEEGNERSSGLVRCYHSGGYGELTARVAAVAEGEALSTGIFTVFSSYPVV